MEQPANQKPAKRRRHQCAGGRPAKWRDGETLGRLLKALLDPAHLTKAAAARAAGISYPTLARWQNARPELHEAWEWMRQSRWECRRRKTRALRQQIQRPRSPAPTKQHRLICWFLVFRVHPEHPLLEEHEAVACERVNLPWERWRAAKERFPRLMANVSAKRARRLAYLVEHGSIDLNWCPPDPARRFDPVYPAFAQHHWQRGKLEDGRGAAEPARSPRTGQRWL